MTRTQLSPQECPCSTCRALPPRLDGTVFRIPYSLYGLATQLRVIAGIPGLAGLAACCADACGPCVESVTGQGSVAAR